MATDLLALLLRDDHPLPPDAVLYFTQSLVHDSISIRKVCIAMCLYRFSFFFLFGLKSKHFMVGSVSPLGYKNGNVVNKTLFFFLLQFFRCKIELPTHNCPVVSHARAAYKHRY